MLWQKETNGDLYIDLFEEEYPILLCRLKRKKSNANALGARMIGNEKFKDGDYYGAMAEYNQSICFAENGSEYLSLAYGNRSSCFEKLKMFSFCLIDIQLAKESNYPQRLMQKLDDRQRKCLLQMQSVESTSQPVLSFPEDEHLPCMANVLRIDVNDEYGRLVTATQDIDIGETVLIEENYIRFVVGENVQCSNCGKQNVNFVPCEKCGGAMFCSELCSKNNFHQIECEMLFDMNICSDGNFFPVYVLRSVIIGLSAFSSTGEMMKFVENCRVGDSNEIPSSILSATSKYRTFFKLASFVPGQLSDQFLDYRKIAYFVHHSIKASSLGVKFQTKSHHRFLAHLIVHHSFILRTNSFGSFETPAMQFSESTNSSDTGNHYEQSLLLVTSYFNHSCCPNVAKLKKNNLSMCKTILPIRKGEQLFISYVDEDDDEYKTEVGRQRLLQNSFGFKCKCAICERGILKNTFILQTDNAFANAVKGLKKLKINFDLSTVSEIIESCKQFLTKFPEMILSAESIYIKHNLAAMMQSEIDHQK